LEQNCSD